MYTHNLYINKHVFNIQEDIFVVLFYFVAVNKTAVFYTAIVALKKIRRAVVSNAFIIRIKTTRSC